jgi:hypothetical protein
VAPLQQSYVDDGMLTSVSECCCGTIIRSHILFLLCMRIIVVQDPRAFLVHIPTFSRYQSHPKGIRDAAGNGLICMPSVPSLSTGDISPGVADTLDFKVNVSSNLTLCNPIHPSRRKTMPGVWELGQDLGGMERCLWVNRHSWPKWWSVLSTPSSSAHPQPPIPSI